jgi:hypothetical protein
MRKNITQRVDLLCSFENLAASEQLCAGVEKGQISPMVAFDRCG